ncbi:MAG: Ig-like domain repeat protein [Anaerolineaceae bacterium]|nr:Ig-like domain repeat protein [Anaerolineaceae bacterium]
MLRKQPGWTPSRIATLAALVLAAGYWFLPTAQIVLAAWMTITPDFSALPGGIVGQAWSRTFTATGGVEPYTWSSSGSIPGLSFDVGSATLSGTPTTVGYFSYTISVEDEDGTNAGNISTSNFLVRANTTTTLSLVSDGPGGQIMVGFPVWANVTVSENAQGTPEPTGQVVVSGGGTSCTVTLVDQQGTCPLFFTSSGSVTITATYQGDTYFISDSTSVTRTVEALSVSPSLTSGRYHTCYQNAAGMVECWGVAKYIPNDGNENDLQPIQVGPLRMVSAGGYHVCGLQTNGTIACWGDNPAVTGAIPAGEFIHISAGLNHVCAVDTSYHVQCWGEMEAALATEPTVEVKAVASGWTHTCAIRKSDNKAICWGDPDDELSAPTFTALSAGKTHTCGIRTDGGIRCWGTITTAPSGTNFVEIGSGSDYSCARTSAGLLTCWGSQAMPVNTTSSHNALGVGALHTCALRDNSAGADYLACWGDNAYGQSPRLSLTPETIDPYIPQNRPYSLTFEAAGGATPYALTRTSGTIPSGLSLSGLTISGTPTTTGDYTPTLQLKEYFPASDLPLELVPVSRGYSMYVQPSWTTTTISSLTPSGATVGAPVNVLVLVGKSSDSDPVVSGSVEVTTDEAGVSCQGEVQADGSAQCTLYFEMPGDHTVTAEYLGDSFYTSSTSSGATYNAAPIVIAPDVSAGDQFTCTINGNGLPVCWGKDDSGQTSVLMGTYTQLSAGGNTTCGRTAGSKLACWGANSYTMATPPAFSGFSDVSVGVEHACARNYNNAIYCWGKSDYTSVPSGYSWRAVSVGDYHSCGLTNTGAGRCWGSSSFNRTAVPAALAADGSVKVIRAGGVFGCAIKADDTLACWGGDGIVDSIKSPPGGSFVDLDAGAFHACALRSDGAVVCWGNNSYGQVGLAASGYGSFSAVGVGVDHTCALRAADQTLECWGANTEGQAPQLALEPATLPTVDANVAWQGQMIAGGGRTSGYVYSWPLDDAPPGLSLDSASGEISGAPNEPGNYVFDISVRESAIDPFMRLSQAYSMTVRSPVSVNTVLDPAVDGMVGIPVRVNVTVAEQPLNLPVMGSQPSGQATVNVDDGRSCSITLANGQGSCEIYFLTAGSKTLTVDYPGDGLFLTGNQILTGAIQIADFQQSDQIFTGAEQTYLRYTDGSLGCVGMGCDQTAFEPVSTTFGTGTGLACALQADGQARCAVAGAEPYLVPGPFVALTVGQGHACALNSSAFPTCWGENAEGQASPVPWDMLKISAGDQHTCALDVHGTPVCWGSDAAGQSTPVGGPYVDITAGGAHTCALDAAGAVTCWGDNAAGQSTPPGRPYSAISAGGNHTCALTAAGLVECWGENAQGQAESPLGTFTAIDAYADHTCALRDGPKLTCWGANGAGEAPQISINELTAGEITALAYWEHEFLPEGGTKPFSGSVAGGVFPPGLDLGLSPAGVVLFGTPTVPDVYNFRLAWESSDAIPLVREEAYILTVTGTDLSLAIQSAPPSLAAFGKPFYWDFTVTNQAAIELPSGELIIQLPATLEGITVTGLTGCVQDGLTLTCPFGPMASGASVTARVEGTITAWVGERVSVVGEAWPLGDVWPEVAEADNRAEDSVMVLGYYIHLPLVLR